MSLPLIHDKAFIVEGLALRLAVVIAIKLSLYKFKVETDSRALVVVLKGGKDTTMEMRKILMDIEELRKQFKSIRVK